MALLSTVLGLTILCTVVTGEEKVKLSEIRNGFMEIDADGDGKATLEEIVKHIETKKELPEADHEGMAQSIFEYYDKNKDGFVTLQEFLPHDEL
ncbi:Hypothetical predicted protein [Mytilus galloprovincialis]|uniref:EF-hand domain-containing protein n=1 Tax=Mytilus galloprovincialis TaxID=29158 RepID=A0A8B6FQC3_MYTGA|nr:Hypothetical predicted protein [Mytilus galloprovincialis]